MRPLPSTTQPKLHFVHRITLAGLLSGIFITALIWLKIPKQAIESGLWLCVALIGILGFMQLRCQAARPRWIIVLAVLAAVSLVYLFPGIFGPTCGGMPRAFARPLAGCGACLEKICEPNPKTHGTHCYCNQWEFYGSACTSTTVPPTIDVATLVCGQAGQDNWCIGSLFLNVHVTEPQGNNVLISGDVNGTPFACPEGTGTASCSIPLPEGQGVVNILATSIIGLSTSDSITYKHDSVQPQINGWLDGIGGTNGWYLSNVDINVSALDPAPTSGLSAFTYNLDSGSRANFPGKLSFSDGVHNLNLNASDAAGNITDINQQIRVDTISPKLNLSVTGTSGANNWYTSTVRVNATASDSGSGVSLIEYDLNNSGWTVYIAPLEITDGIHSLSLRVSDNAGNITKTNQTIKVDTITPTLELSASGVSGLSGWYTSTVQVSGVADDSGSGLDIFEYNLDNAGWESYNTPLELSDGVHALDLRVFDRAGNTITETQTFLVDTTLPTLKTNISGTNGDNNWYTSITQIKVIAEDATSGLSTLEVELDGNGWASYTAPLALGDGLHRYRFHAQDNAGNQVETALQNIKVDTIPPFIVLPESWALGEIAYFELEDTGSGLSRVRLVIEDEDERYPKVTWEDGLESHKFKGEINWDGRFKDGIPALPGGEYYAWLKISDNAGNESRLAGLIDVPIGNFVETLFQKSPDNQGGVLVSGTEASDPIAQLDASTNQPVSNGSATLIQPPIVRLTSVLNLGGENNNITSPGQTDFSLGGESNGSEQSSNTQTEIENFNAGGTSNAPEADATSNILWGATATAAIGAFMAEITRRKQEQEAIQAALRELIAEGNQERKRIAANYKASLDNFKNTLAKASALGLSKTAAAALEENVRKTGSIGASLGAASIFVAEAREKVRAGTNEIEAEKQLDYQDPSLPKTQSYIVPDMNLKRDDIRATEQVQQAQEEAAKQIAYDIYRAQEVAAPPNWWELTKSYLKENIIQPVNTNIFQPYVKPAAEKVGEAVVAGVSWLDNNIYQPYVKPALEVERQKITNAISWINDEIYQPYVQPKLEDTLQDISTAITRVNEQIYQPYIQPTIEKAIQAVTDGISWTNEKIFQPFIQPILEKEIQGVAAGISWANEKIYQPYIQPALDEALQNITSGISWANEKIFQPYVQPAMEKATQAVAAGLTWLNEEVYQPIFQPVVEDMLKVAVAGISLANEKIYQPYIQPTLASFNENIYQSYVKPFINGVVDSLGENTSFVNEFFYQPFIQPIVAEINQSIYQPYIKPLQDDASARWNETWDKYGEWVHGAMDAVGFIPGLGDIADGINGLIYLGEGRYLEASISALSMIPLIGDLSKGGKWGFKLGKEVAEELVEETLEVVTEKTIKEIGEVFVEEVEEKLFLEASEEVVERTGTEIIEEVEERVIHDVSEEVAEHASERAVEEVGESVLQESTEDLIEKSSKEILEETGEKLLEKTAGKLTDQGAEKLTKEVSNEVVVTAVKDTAEAIPTVVTKNTTNNLTSEVIEASVEQTGKVSAQFIDSLREKYGDEMVDRFLPFCEKFGIDPYEVLTRPPAEGQTLIGWGLGIDNPANPANHPLVQLSLTKDELDNILVQSIKNPNSKVAVLGYGNGVAKPYFKLGDEIDGCFLSISDEAWKPFDAARANFLIDINIPFVEKAIEERKMILFNINKKTITDPLNAERFSLPELKLIELPSNNYVRVELEQYELYVPKELQETYLELLPQKLLGELIK